MIVRKGDLVLEGGSRYMRHARSRYIGNTVSSGRDIIHRGNPLKHQHHPWRLFLFVMG